MIPIPDGQKCQKCKRVAISFHPYIGFVCQECLKLAQSAFNVCDVKLEKQELTYEI